MNFFLKETRMSESLLNRLYEEMISYQQKNNIKGKCIANSLYFCDSMKERGIECTIAATIAVYEINEALGFHIHMVVRTGQYCYDPSWEVVQHNPKYLGNTKVILNFLKDHPYPDPKGLLTQFLKFAKIAQDLNTNQKSCIEDEHYQKQADYIQSIFKSLPAKNEKIKNI
jgi:hypothetical protein